MSFMASIWLLSLLFSISITANSKKVYIIHMDHTSKPESFATHHDWYVFTLQSHTSSTIQDSLVYTYTHGFHGFAAYIDPQEAEALKQRDYVFGVYEDKIRKALTTRTPTFLGIDGSTNFANLVGNYKNFKEIDQASHDIVIGVIDSGVWPESKSFDDTGMPDIPKKWRVVCESTPDFSPKLCNKKLITARAFLKAYFRKVNDTTHFSSPRDIAGHGSHTASTIAGSPVPNASLFGYANGTARGMASRARVAIYKVCFDDNSCMEADIMKGMLQAVKDGCHVLSISLEIGDDEFYQDPSALAALVAVNHGVVVSAAGGNSGPNASSMSAMPPWILTAGASTLDRTFPAYVLLGNKKKFPGVSLATQKFNTKQMKLTYNKEYNSHGNLCLPVPINPTLARGQIVICDNQDDLSVKISVFAQASGAAGMILVLPTNDTEAMLDIYTLVLPSVIVDKRVGDAIKKYVMSNPHATATLIYGKTAFNTKPSPIIASFSSRGPNTLAPQILKPDLVAPGVNILAAWPSNIHFSLYDADPRRTKFNIISGTSMACPHVSGIVALLKVAHPDWSPSVIKSALMTTAYTLDRTNSPLRDYDGTFSTPLEHGAGHVDPQKALSPGLVYDIKPAEYIKFMCSLGYPAKIVEAYFKEFQINSTCSNKFSDPGQLNYPSFSIWFKKGKRAFSYTRELTNVGAAGSVYDVIVHAPPSVTLTIKPTKLFFKRKGDTQRYTITFVAKKGANPSDGFTSGSIAWVNPEHNVRSPIVFLWS